MTEKHPPLRGGDRVSSPAQDNIAAGGEVGRTPAKKSLNVGHRSGCDAGEAALRRLAVGVVFSRPPAYDCYVFEAQGPCRVADEADALRERFKAGYGGLWIQRRQGNRREAGTAADVQQGEERRSVDEREERVNNLERSASLESTPPQSQC